MTARQVIMEGNEGCSFRDVIDNLTEEDILNCMEEYSQIGYKKLIERLLVERENFINLREFIDSLLEDLK